MIAVAEHWHHPSKHPQTNNSIQTIKPYENWVQPFIQQVTSIKEQVQLINLLKWRKNTTMPIQRILNFSFIHQNLGNPSTAYPKHIYIEIQKISSNQYHRLLNLSEAVYMIIQMIIGRHAIIYKLGVLEGSRYHGFGVNQFGQCRIVMPICLRFKQENAIQSTYSTQNIIHQVFLAIMKISQPQIHSQLIKIHEILKNNPLTISGSSATFIIQQYCYKVGINILCNISLKQPKNKFIGKNQELSRSYIAHKIIKDDEQEASMLENKRKNKIMAYSYCPQQLPVKRIPVNWSYVNRDRNSQINDVMIKSSSNLAPQKKNKCALAFSLCILPPKKANTMKSSLNQFSKTDLQMKNTECLPVSTKKYNKSNTTTSIGSFNSQFFQSQRVFNTFKQQLIYEEKQIRTDQKIIQKKHFQQSSNIQEFYQRKPSKLMSLFDQQKNKIQELNQSYSICDSPVKKKEPLKLLDQSEYQEEKNLISQLKIYSIKEQAEQREIPTFSGWNLNLNVLNEARREVKESVYCGNQSQINQYGYLEGLELSKLGTMGRIIGKSQICDNY